MNLKNLIWDKIGICASSLCLIHCLTTPIILLAFPFLHESWMHESVHIICAIIVVVSVMIAIFPHCKKHGHYDIIAIACLGCLLVISGIFLEEKFGEWMISLTVLGSIVLVWAHLKNMKVKHGKCAHNH